jgi:perosamine synthetase
MRATDLIRGFGLGLTGSRANRALCGLLEKVSGAAQCLPVSSGRAAMTMIFRAMRESRRGEPHRDEVIMPAYTCYSVAAAAIRAGLTPRLCDVDPSTLGIDLEALERTDFSRALTVVSANLYGIPNQLGEIERIARERGVYMLDDAAQALGACVAGRAVGAFGDAGLFSFDKGKIICTVQGGAVIAHDSELGRQLADSVRALPASGTIETALNCTKLLAYALLLRPSFYGLVQQIPFLGLGKTTFETRYPIEQLSSLQGGVAVQLARRIEELNEQRRRNARQLADALRPLPNVTLPVIADDAHAVYARFPVRITGAEIRHNAVALLNRNGIGATTSYPLALADVPKVQAVLRQPTSHLAGARALAAQIVTLPTHGYCPPNLGERIARVMTTQATKPELALRA